MGKSNRMLDEGIRNHYMEMVAKALTDAGEEVLHTGNNEWCIPCVDEEGNEKFLVLTFKVPTGTRDGEPYDGYEMCKEFAFHQQQKAEKAEAAAKAKAKKIERDKAMREAKAKLKEKREG